MEGGYIGQQPSWNEHLRSGVWSLSDQFNRRKNNLWSVSQDPYAANVVLHLKGDGDYLDSSANPKTVLATSTTFDSTIKKYGTSSIKFAQTNGYLTLQSHPDFIFNGDFTIETWFYSGDNTTVGQCFFDSRINTSLVNKLAIQTNTGKTISVNSNSGAITFSFNQLNSWRHLAVCRTNGVLSFFNNGVKLSSSLSINEEISGGFLIGRIYNLSTISFSGYFDSYRITKGIGRYNSNFNPETDTYLSY